jgi:hypothetical protein
MARAEEPRTRGLAFPVHPNTTNKPNGSHLGLEITRSM